MLGRWDSFLVPAGVVNVRLGLFRVLGAEQSLAVSQNLLQNPKRTSDRLFPAMLNIVSLPGFVAVCFLLAVATVESMPHHNSLFCIRDHDCGPGKCNLHEKVEMRLPSLSQALYGLRRPPLFAGHMSTPPSTPRARCSPWLFAGYQLRT